MGSGGHEGLTVMIAGGGTGGHLFPGLALAAELERRGGVHICFVGSAYGIEARVIPREGYPLRLLSVRALRRQGVARRVSSLVGLVRSLVEAWRIVSELRPALVVGVGGYASAPAVAVARLRGVPTVLLEQNSIPGLANRLLARVAERICVAFPDSAAFFPRGRTVHTGNPVRLPLAPAEAAAKAGPFSILVFGGSAGARRLNEVGAEAMARLRDAGFPVRVVHQTGEADLGTVRERYAALGIDADVRAFIDDMPTAYAEADLVICRAGATTLAELTAFGKPSVLVPYPFATDDHQRRNAESLVRAGAAAMILDRELGPERLADEILRFRREPEKLERMAAAARGLGRPDAAGRVADVCLEVAGVA